MNSYIDTLRALLNDNDKLNELSAEFATCAIVSAPHREDVTVHVFIDRETIEVGVLSLCDCEQLHQDRLSIDSAPVSVVENTDDVRSDTLEDIYDGIVRNIEQMIAEHDEMARQAERL